MPGEDGRSDRARCAAVADAGDLDVLIEGIETPDSKTFSEIARKDGIKAALKWRDSRFDTGAAN